jgi:hypothetical protein
MLPGSRSFDQELEAYNRDAAPSPLYSPTSRFGSVVTDPSKPLEPSGGERERQMQMAMQMPMMGHLLVHGTPTTWAAEAGAPLGQFRRTFKHTGEGGAYKGAGGYVAEAPAVGERYRTGLSEPDVRMLRPEVEPKSTAQSEAVENLRRRILNDKDDYGQVPSKEYSVNSWKQGLDWQAKEARRRAAEARAWHEGRPEYADKIREYGATPLEDVLKFEAEAQAADELAAWARGIRHGDIDLSTGNLYALDFPDERLGQVLDFDLPLEQQSPEVQASLRKALADAGFEPWQIDAQMAKATGETAYTNIASNRQNKLGLETSREGEEAASQFLAERGIPAHKFWDQASRDAATGTKNFVVYEPDKTLTTLSKFGSLEEMNREVLAPIQERLMKKAEEAAAQGRKGEAEWIRSHASTLDLARPDYERHFKKVLDALKGQGASP